MTSFAVAKARGTREVTVLCLPWTLCLWPHEPPFSPHSEATLSPLVALPRAGHTYPVQLSVPRSKAGSSLITRRGLCSGQRRHEETEPQIQLHRTAPDRTAAVRPSRQTCPARSPGLSGHNVAICMNVSTPVTHHTCRWSGSTTRCLNRLLPLIFGIAPGPSTVSPSGR